MESNDKATMIRPGLMVSVKSTVSGGVSYQRVDLDASLVTDSEYEPGVPGKACTVCNSAWPASEEEVDTCHATDCTNSPTARSAKGSEVRRWETTKVVDDPAELHAASQARSKALRAIRKVCARTSFGLLCPTSLEEQLDAGIATARAIIAAHNAVAKTTKIGVYVLKGRVASDDVEATKAIAQEVRELVNEMSAGIDKLDAARIRDAADKAKELGAMLGDDQAATVSAAVDAARKAARQIVARIETKGEDAAVVMLDIQRGALEKARIAFLDYDVTPTNGTASPAVEAGRFASLDMGDEPKTAARASNETEDGYAV